MVENASEVALLKEEKKLVEEAEKRRIAVKTKQVENEEATHRRAEEETRKHEEERAVKEQRGSAFKVESMEVLVSETYDRN